MARAPSCAGEGSEAAGEKPTFSFLRILESNDCVYMIESAALRVRATVHDRGAKQRAPTKQGPKRQSAVKHAEPEYLGDRDRSFAAICLSRV